MHNTSWHVKKRALLVVLLVLAIGNYVRIGDPETRTVELFSILVMGALAGILLVDVMRMFRRK